MTSQECICQTLLRDCDLPGRPEKEAWLIKGDFDHFRLSETLYGSLIADYLLDWTLEVIEAELKVQQNRWGCGEPLCSVMGDDLTVYVPPSGLAAEDIKRLLWKIREAIRQSFWRRYLVGAVPLPTDFFDGVSLEALERINAALNRMDAVLDFAARRRGFLLLLPVGADGNSKPTLDRAIRIIQREAGKPIPPLDLELDWICNPEDDSCCAFNQGFLDPPSVSFAACSTRTEWAGGSHRQEDASFYERVSLVCQATLKICKQQRKGVLIHPEGDFIAEPPSHLAASPAFNPSFHLRWSSERYLREQIYFQQLDRPVLFQLNPVYSLSSRPPGDTCPKDQYRGNSYGMGLKGINDIYGQATADRIICQSMAIFSEVLGSILAEKGGSPESVRLAQFADRLTLCCARSIFQLPEIIELVCSLAVQFNAHSEDIKISQLCADVVMGENRMVGYRLLERLALTGLSSKSSTLVNADPRVVVRQSDEPAVEEGRLTQERSAYESARLLAFYHEDTVYRSPSCNKT